jgi:hypothetical protein
LGCAALWQVLRCTRCEDANGLGSNRGIGNPCNAELLEEPFSTTRHAQVSISGPVCVCVFVDSHAPKCCSRMLPGYAAAKGQAAMWQ